MRFKGLLLFSFLLTIAVTPAFAQYTGDDVDGSSVGAACVTTLDGVDQFTFASAVLSGSSTFCDFSSEAYSVSLTNGPQDVVYYWSLPAGAAILSGDFTANITVAFGNTAGTVSVMVVTACGSTTLNMPVTNGTCSMYQGADNDGFSKTPSCVTDLDGTPASAVGATIAGSPEFCIGGTESYSVQVTNPPQGIIYNWTVPAGATVFQGQNTSTIIVSFGSSAGDVSVDIITECSTTTLSTPVTGVACPFYAGGDNDGFSESPSCSITLDGAPQYAVAAAITGSPDFCVGATDSYSIQVDNAPQGITYVWTVPAGSTVFQGQSTNTIIVAFGSTPGNVSVDIITDCSTETRTIAVSSQTCSFYAGGNNDGFSKGPSCVTTLDGGPQFSITGIAGSATFCEFGTEGFSIVTVNPPIDIYYNWTVPAGATIVSGQGTANITVLFGNTSGDINVDVISDCATVPATPFAVTSTVCSFYAGGNNDGFSDTQRCATKLDGTDALILGAIVGSTTFCDFGTESYTVSIQGSNPETTIVWSVPPGATIVSGQGTTTILVAFSSTDGNVGVVVTNACSSLNTSLAVTTTACVFYAGGNNDGFSQTRTCATDLNGGSVFSAGTITGSPAFCSFSSESYSIAVAGATPTTTYTWTVPAGASIVSGQGTTTILVSFGNTNGNVAVAVANECQTINVSLPVTGSSCVFYAGGTGDGFSVTTATNIPLPISLVSFDAEVENGVVFLKWETSSEFENDFFLVERSKDGRTFEALTKVEGAGTSKQSLKYQALDSNPYHGTSYYRLSQTDYDGTIEYFRTLMVKIETFAEVTKLYPNPVGKDDLLHIDYFAEEEGQVKISIVNPSGLSTESKMIDVTAGVNLFEFTPHFQTAGVHVIIIRSKDKATTLKLVVL